jgi:hypothetical protein
MAGRKIFVRRERPLSRNGLLVSGTQQRPFLKEAVSFKNKNIFVIFLI